MADSNEILKKEEKDREALYHEIVWSEFDFAKNFARCLSGGKENVSLEKEIIEEIIRQLEAFLDEPNCKKEK